MSSGIESKLRTKDSILRPTVKDREAGPESRSSGLTGQAACEQQIVNRGMRNLRYCLQVKNYPGCSRAVGCTAVAQNKLPRPLRSSGQPVSCGRAADAIGVTLATSHI